MNQQGVKKIIVVLSAGRSGTSLLMKVLARLGMGLSKNTISGSISNPDGFYEDTEIVQVHKDLIKNLNTTPVLPLPDGWLRMDATRKAQQKLSELVGQRLAEVGTIWGFKDPRTAVFLPLWNKILNVPGKVPVFLLAVRDPAVVSASLKRQIDRDEAITELQWLQRTTDAIYHTGADCFVLHYEDWFSHSNELCQGLLRYTGLAETFRGNLDDTLKDLIKPNLNRSIYEAYQVENEYVAKLYNVLTECRGDQFDRMKLMEAVKDCRNVMNGFRGWYLETHRHIRTPGKLKESPEKLIAQYKSDLQAITIENNAYLQQLKELGDERTNLTIKNNTSIQKLKELEGERNRFKLQFSTHGELPVDAQEHLRMWLKMLSIDYYYLINSFRWNFGDRVVRIAEILLLQRRKPMATDAIEKHFIFNEIGSNELAALINKLNQIRRNFEALFASSRWKIGNGVVTIAERLFLWRNQPFVYEQVQRTFTEFDDFKVKWGAPATINKADK